MTDKMITDSEAMHFFTTDSGRNVVAHGWMTTLSTSPDDVLSADIGVLLLDVGVFVRARSHRREKRAGMKVAKPTLTCQARVTFPPRFIRYFR